MNRKLLKLNQKKGKFFIQDIWPYYVANVLSQNPSYYTRRCKGGMVDKDYYILTRYKGPGTDPEDLGEEIEVMSYARFRAIVNAFLQDVSTELIFGAVFNLGSYLGRLRAVRVQRNHSNKMVNWGETMKGGKDPVTGKYVKVVYHGEDYWARIKWRRLGKITNERSYIFSPARGEVGLKNKFSEANIANPNLSLRYPYERYIKD
jgi:hypothetical protein